MNMRVEFPLLEEASQPPVARARRAGAGAFLRTPLRRLSFRRILRGGRVDDAGRLPRYGALFLLVAAAIWGPLIAYIKLTPPGYASGMSLILPGTGSSASVNLSDIGQASSSASSPYASSAVSPTVTYKNLLASDRVRRAAAESLGVPFADFGAPRIKLVDQTSLIHVETKAGDPDAARTRGEALLAAFMAELSTLRADEVARREQSFRGAISEYRDSVARTRAEITRLQSETGLISVAQYAGMVAEADALEIRVRDLGAGLSLKEKALSALTAALGVAPGRAALTLKLHADPEFQSLTAAMAAHGAEMATARATYGPKHPTRLAAEEDYAGARARAQARARAVTGLSDEEIAATVDLSPTGERAALLSQLVTLAAEREGLAAEHETLSARLTATRAQVLSLVEAASRLDDLGRDYQVAEAVFTTALARNDTTKSDIYASYPLIQVLEPPTTPDAPSSPNVKIALAAGVAATFLALVALLMGWLRRPLIDRLLRRTTL